MCGLVGMAGSMIFKDEMVMKRLLILDYFRGPDSTGYASVRNNGDVKIAKLASHPLDLFEDRRFNAAINAAASVTMIGHNRAATKGLVNNTNAHPFEFDHIVGAHNGTLAPAAHKRLEDAIGETFPVDSMAIFAAIAKLGIDETIPLLTGAWALTYYDSNEKTMNFIRNKERPLWYGFDKDCKKMLWASEFHMMGSAVDSGTAAAFEFFRSEEGHRFFQFKEDTLYTIDPTSMNTGGGTRPKPKVRELKGREPEPVVTTTRTYTPFDRTPSTGSATGATTNSRGTTSTKEPTEVHLFGNAVEPFGGFIDKMQFDEWAKHGCAFCGESVEYSEIGVTVIERIGAVLCPTHSRPKTNASTIVARDISMIAELAGGNSADN